MNHQQKHRHYDRSHNNNKSHNHSRTSSSNNNKNLMLKWFGIMVVGLFGIGLFVSYWYLPYPISRFLNQKDQHAFQIRRSTTQKQQLQKDAAIAIAAQQQQQSQQTTNCYDITIRIGESISTAITITTTTNKE